MVRLTKVVREALLQQNDGFTTQTNYSGKNFAESRTYTILNGELLVRQHGNTSWADSRYNGTYVADEAETHRFLRNYLRRLNTDGFE